MSPCWGINRYLYPSARSFASLGSQHSRGPNSYNYQKISALIHSHFLFGIFVQCLNCLNSSNERVTSSKGKPSFSLTIFCWGFNFFLILMQIPRQEGIVSFDPSYTESFLRISQNKTHLGFKKLAWLLKCWSNFSPSYFYVWSRRSEVSRS